MCLGNPCTYSLTITNSNRDDSYPCSATTGNECTYTCNTGYTENCSHTCGTDGTFSGGSCLENRCFIDDDDNSFSSENIQSFTISSNNSNLDRRNFQYMTISRTPGYQYISMEDGLPDLVIVHKQTTWGSNTIWIAQIVYGVDI